MGRPRFPCATKPPTRERPQILLTNRGQIGPRQTSFARENGNDQGVALVIWCRRTELPDPAPTIGDSPLTEQQTPTGFENIDRFSGDGSDNPCG